MLPRARRPRVHTQAHLTLNPISHAIRSTRVAHNLSQFDISVRSGVCLTSIQRMEAGHLGQYQNILAVLTVLNLTLTTTESQCSTGSPTQPISSTLPPWPWL